jgi:hypothetical protein
MSSVPKQPLDLTTSPAALFSLLVIILSSSLFPSPSLGREPYKGCAGAFTTHFQQLALKCLFPIKADYHNLLMVENKHLK